MQAENGGNGPKGPGGPIGGGGGASGRLGSLLDLYFDGTPRIRGGRDRASEQAVLGGSEPLGPHRDHHGGTFGEPGSIHTAEGAEVGEHAPVGTLDGPLEQVCTANERCHEDRLGMLVDLQGCADLLDSPLVHDRHAV